MRTIREMRALVALINQERKEAGIDTGSDSDVTGLYAVLGLFAALIGTVGAALLIEAIGRGLPA